MKEPNLTLVWNDEVLKKARLSKESIEKFLNVLGEGIINNISFFKNAGLNEISFYAEVDKKECAIIYRKEKKQLKIYFVLGHKFDSKKIICELKPE